MAALAYWPDLMEVCCLPGARIQDPAEGGPDLSGYRTITPSCSSVWAPMVWPGVGWMVSRVPAEHWGDGEGQEAQMVSPQAFQ